MPETTAPEIDVDATVARCVAQLARSETGQAAAGHVLALLEGRPLDGVNQRALVYLLNAAWTGRHGTVTHGLRSISPPH